MEMSLIHRADAAERARPKDEFRVISEAALALWGWRDERYKRVLRLLEAGASLDAAMSLVPEGWWIGELSENPERTRGYVDLFAATHPSVEGKGSSLALALLAASLRARAHQSGERK